MIKSVKVCKVKAERVFQLYPVVDVVGDTTVYIDTDGKRILADTKDVVQSQRPYDMECGIDTSNHSVDITTPDGKLVVSLQPGTPEWMVLKDAMKMIEEER